MIEKYVSAPDGDACLWAPEWISAHARTHVYIFAHKRAERAGIPVCVSLLRRACMCVGVWDGKREAMEVQWLSLEATAATTLQGGRTWGQTPVYIAQSRVRVCDIPHNRRPADGRDGSEIARGCQTIRLRKPWRLWALVYFNRLSRGILIDFCVAPLDSPRLMQLN